MPEDLQQFQQSIREGIPSTLPPLPPEEEGINHAGACTLLLPVRKHPRAG